MWHSTLSIYQSLANVKSVSPHCWDLVLNVALLAKWFFGWLWKGMWCSSVLKSVNFSGLQRLVMGDDEVFNFFGDWHGWEQELFKGIDTLGGAICRVLLAWDVA